jgi:hypothetical protein
VLLVQHPADLGGGHGQLLAMNTGIKVPECAGGILRQLKVRRGAGA